MSDKDRNTNKGAGGFGFVDFLVRLAAALVLVLVTYNPTGWSYIHWLKTRSVETVWAPCIFWRAPY